MARLEQAPSGRRRCATCGAAIARGSTSIVDEELHDIGGGERISRRYSHVACAVKQDAALAHAALRTTASPRELIADVLAEVIWLDPRLGHEVAAQLRVAEHVEAAREERERAEAPVSPDPEGDAHLAALLGELVVTPSDRAVLGVVADVLQRRGDPRGELIALELAITDDAGPAMIERRAELRGQLTPRLAHGESCTWGLGYLASLKLKTTLVQPLAALRHPSARLLVALSVVQPSVGAFAILTAAHVPALRRLTLQGTDLARVVALLPTLVHLERVALAGECAHDELGHPRVTWLELDRVTNRDVRMLVPPAWPRLERLTLRAAHVGHPLAGLVAGSVVERIAQLDLPGTRFDRDTLDELATALDGRRLPRIDVTTSTLAPEHAARLVTMCDELVGVAPRGHQQV